MIWSCADFVFRIDEPLVMGILNVTPDSFSDGGLYDTLDSAVAWAEKLVADGADIIDVGGESTRPGSAALSEDEELRRVEGVVRELAAQGYPVSIDTRHAAVAQAALLGGACIINDISGFRDRAMRKLAARSDAGLVVMHMLGDPATMQDDPHYDDVVGEVEAYLLGQAHALEEEGVASKRICIDPGCGFGKTCAHNLALLAATPRLASHGYPLMVAVSRKRFIGAMTGIECAAKRDRASALVAAAACKNGAKIARVHDVAATREALRNSHRAVVALGSNMGDPISQLDAAIAALRRVAGVWICDVSSYYESAPAYVQDQPHFVNAVCLMQTTLDPSALLDVLHGIEDAAHRVRTDRFGPRTLDLDIVDYEGIVRSDPALTLPHPRALERDFVVTGLLEIASDYVLSDGKAVTFQEVNCGKVGDVVKARFA